jgi:hypothetical protein
VTSNQSDAGHPEVRQTYIEARALYHSLSLVSKKMNLMATPYLYRTVILFNPDELVCLFRTLATKVDLRELIRSFAWLGVLSMTPDHEEATLFMEDRVASMAPALLASVKWPHGPEQCSVARHTGMRDASSVSCAKLLSVVMAFMPRLEKIFSMQSLRLGVDETCPELQAFRGLLAGTRCCLPMPYLTTVTMEPQAQHRFIEMGTPRMLRGALGLSRSIRRIELKGTWSLHIEFTATPPQFPNMREVLFLQAELYPNNMAMIAILFPKLESLEVECVSTRAKLDQVNYPALLWGIRRLSPSLKRLSLTTQKGADWAYIALWPYLWILREMRVLEHLRLESTCLFPRPTTSWGDPIRIIHRLPKRLQDFHLVDFWGNESVTGSRVYPAFMGGRTALQFYHAALWALARCSPTRFPRLRKVTLSLHPRRPQTYKRTRLALPEEIERNQDPFTVEEQWLYDALYKVFKDVGVEFILRTPFVARSEIWPSWANMD